MIEFVNSCYVWLAENYKEITMVLTSAQFASVLSALFLLFRSIRKTDENVKSSKELNKVLNDTIDTSETIKILKNDIETLKAENEQLRNLLTENQNSLVDFLNSHSAKLNTMLEVQSIVYSTIKDDNIRNTVNSLLVNAKYNETSSRVKLRQEIETLKIKVAEKIQEVSEDVDKTVATVKNIVDPDADSIQNITRY